MTTYLVEHYWPGITTDLFESAASQVSATASELAREGVEVRFLHSTLVLDEESAFCVFEAESQGAVAEAYARAGVRFERVVEAVEIRDHTTPRRTKPSIEPADGRGDPAQS